MRHRFSSLVLSCAIVLSGAGAIGAAPAAGQSPPQKQPVAEGYGGAVVSDTVPSTQAGIAVLRNGGTAADAAVAVAATLGVTDPYVAGIGGGGYFVYYDAKRHQVFTIDGRETTPAADGQNMFINPATGQPYSFPTAVTSGLSVGVPGTLATWQRALDRWGRFNLARDLQPAINVADQGFVVDPTFREFTRENQSRFAQFTSTRDLFLSGGALPDVGSVFRNPDLANTYRQIAHDWHGCAVRRTDRRRHRGRRPQPAARAGRDPDADSRADDVGRSECLPHDRPRPDARQLPRAGRLRHATVVEWRHHRG